MLWKVFDFVTLSNFIREIIFLCSYQTVGKIIKVLNWPTEKHLLHLPLGKDGKMCERKRKVPLCRNFQIQYIHINTHISMFLFMNVYIYEHIAIALSSLASL